MPPFSRQSRSWRSDLKFAAIVFFAVLFGGLGAALVGQAPVRTDNAHSMVAPRLYVIDGDTMEETDTGVRLRIANIDTPEIHEPGCGAEARLGQRARRMSQNILRDGERIEVRRIGRRDRFGRDLAYIRVDGRDLGESLISAGLARPWEGRRRAWCRADGSVRL